MARAKNARGTRECGHPNEATFDSKKLGARDGWSVGHSCAPRPAATEPPTTRSKSMAARGPASRHVVSIIAKASRPHKKKPPPAPDKLVATPKDTCNSEAPAVAPSSAGVPQTSHDDASLRRAALLQVRRAELQQAQLDAETHGLTWEFSFDLNSDQALARVVGPDEELTQLKHRRPTWLIRFSYDAPIQLLST